MSKEMNVFDCAVIGAGASGIMAAITAARSGAKVILVEHQNKIGKKLFATGNGKCNFTNSYMNDSCYHGDSSLFPIRNQFDEKSVISFFHEIGVYPKQKNGYYYPNSEQAASLVATLDRELKRQDVTILLEAQISSISEDKYGFTLNCNQNKIKAKTIIFAVGLLASPKLGSDGSAFELIKSFGHHFTSLVPALCGFYADGFDFKQVSGVRCDALVSIYSDGVEVASNQGELQLTEYGISGIPVFQVSRFGAYSLKDKKRTEAVIRFLPELSEEEIKDELQYRIQNNKSIEAYDLLNGLLHQKLIPAILYKANMKENQLVSELSQVDALIQTIISCKIKLLKVRDYEFAQVCAGGLKTEDIDVHTLMSLLVPGIFFCGELLNVDGICGGYNLQWAWSSGYVAGKNAAAFCKKDIL